MPSLLATDFSSPSSTASTSHMPVLQAPPPTPPNPLGILPQFLSIDATLGAAFIGFAVACVVYGILITQIFSYFRRYPGDKWFHKVIVVLILLLETADQTFIGHLVYYYSVSNFANPIVLLKAKMIWSLVLQPTMGAIVGAIVKILFGLRVWRFSGRNFWITGIILTLPLAQLGLAMAFSIKAFRAPDMFAAIANLQTLGTISLAFGVGTDVITAGALCYFLSRLRTVYKESDSLVNSLVRYAINTGGLTSAVSLSVLLLYNVLPHDNLYFVAMYFNLGKLYAISYMATLNTRRTVKGRGTDRQGNTSNNANMFHLGARMPSAGPGDVSPSAGPRDEDRWSSLKASSNAAANKFPLNSFHPGVGKTRQARAI